MLHAKRLRSHIPLKLNWLRQSLIFFFIATTSYIFCHNIFSLVTGGSAARSGGETRWGVCQGGGGNGRRRRRVWVHRRRSVAGSIHGGLLWDADKVWARALKTLQRSHVLPSEHWASVQSPHHWFSCRLWWRSLLSQT